MIRSDNGSEFVSHSFSTYLSSIGVIHQTSCSYTPQQNAKFERKHIHLLEMARALRDNGLCFAYVHPSEKFAPRAIKVIFLGYPFN